MFTTWSEANREITDDLSSTFTRRDIAATDSDVFIYGANIGVAYLEYTRTRTKRYKYVGMTHAVALQCEAAMNALYTRCCYKWEYDSDYRVFRMMASPTNRDYFIVRGGSATAKPSGGCMWQVDVDVNETITIPYRQLVSGSTPEAAARMPHPWLDFEQDPSIMTDAFRGRAATSSEIAQGFTQDFLYDTRSVGWGSAEDTYNHKTWGS